MEKAETYPHLLGSQLWQPALDKYAEATGLTVELYDVGGNRVLVSSHLTPLLALFREHGYDPGLFGDCARLQLKDTPYGARGTARPTVCRAEPLGLAVIGTSLVLEGRIVGAAVAGYVLLDFANVSATQRCAKTSGVAFERLWNLTRGQPPVPERRLMLHGELLQVLGNTLLQENHRTRQYEETVDQLKAAAAAKDEFLAVLSHELRSPLAAIAGWAGVLKMSESREHSRRAAEAIERNVGLQSRMVEDLLDVNRISSGNVTLKSGTHKLQALVGAALEAIARDVEVKSIRLQLVAAEEPLFVEGDSDRVQQVFRNIFSNAVKFTPPEGVIRVAVKREADRACVVVSDSGIGITLEFLPFVFDIFRQQERGTRREYSGLGIGLALVKRLVELQKGTVRIDSAGEGRGTEVTVEFPVAEVPALKTAHLETRIAPAALAGLSVLVVEDSEDSRESLRILLQLLGAHVVVARDGREALDMIVKVDPDLVLCDLRMPRMDGFEFMRELNRPSAPAHPPVVAMSGFVSEADREITRKAGFEGHINKPFDEATMIAAVGTVVRQRQERTSTHETQSPLQ